jgi:hypothetical protein
MVKISLEITMVKRFADIHKSMAKFNLCIMKLIGSLNQPVNSVHVLMTCIPFHNLVHIKS